MFLLNKDFWDFGCIIFFYLAFFIMILAIIKVNDVMWRVWIQKYENLFFKVTNVSLKVLF